LPTGSSDEIGIYSAHNLFIELYDAFGYLPYPADRHTSEFLPFTLSGFPPTRKATDSDGVELDVLNYCDIARTPILKRRKTADFCGKRILESAARLKDSTGETPPKSRETGADMIWAYLNNQTVTDAVNTLNIGQIEGLPLGACVETMGTVDGFGVRPITVRKVPEILLEIMRPQAVCSKWIVEAVLEHNKELLFHALYRDPQCAHLSFAQIKQMGGELLEANKKFVNW